MRRQFHGVIVGRHLACRRVASALVAGAFLTFCGTAVANSVYGVATASGYGGSAAFGSCTTGVIPCPTGELTGYALASSNTAASNAFEPLLANMGGAGHMHWARFSIPYDALEIENSSDTGCVQSPGYTNGGSTAFQKLVWDIQAADQDLLTPEVTLGTGTGDGAPSTPDPGFGRGTRPFVAMTQAGDDYRCGVTAIMTALAPGNSGGLPAVVNWEAWNEPNGGSAYNGALPGECTTPSSTNPCAADQTPSGTPYGSGTSLCNSSGSSPSSGDCGPIEASELWELANVAATQITAITGTSVHVAALTLAMSSSASSNTAWDNAYAAGIEGSTAGEFGFMAGDGSPSIWAVHDYADVLSWPSIPVISSFTSWLDSTFGSGLTVWITEAAVDLRPSCSGAPCNPTSADGSPSTQTQDAQNFLKLQNNGDKETIADVNWFEFEPANRSSGWDSGMLSAGPGPELPPDGLTSQKRSSYCVLTGQSDCGTSAFDASDWSTSWDAASAPIGAVAVSGTSTATQVQVQWQPGATAPAGTTYAIFASGSSTPAITNAPCTQQTNGYCSPQTLTALPPNTSIGFSVSAIVAGIASPGSVSSVVTLASTPTGLAAGTPTATNVPLTWTEPAGGNPPRSYQILECQGTPGACGSSSYVNVQSISGQSVTFSGRAATVSALTPDTAYSFEIEAINSVGAISAPSSQVAAETQGAGPSISYGPVSGLPEIAVQGPNNERWSYYQSAIGAFSPVEIGGNGPAL
jgi:hypothetical protein